jgi:kinesin family member 20
MEFNPNHKKTRKQLDFYRQTFDETEFKKPFIGITNNHEQPGTSERSRHPSEKSGFADDEGDSRDSDLSSASTIVSEKVMVFLRLKPTKQSIPDVYRFDDETSSVFLRSNLQNSRTNIDRQFVFSSILSQQTDQKALYERSVRTTLSDPFSSTGCVVCSYGVSNSGKTYTILGEESAGVIPRALTQIFTEYDSHIAKYPVLKVVNDQIKILEDSDVEAELCAPDDFLKESRKLHKGKSHNGWIDAIKSEHDFQPKQGINDTFKVYIWISFIEIYNKKIIDLFKVQSTGQSSTLKHSLKIIANNGNPYILNATWLTVCTIESAIELLQQGLLRVNYASTGINAHSSRSHTIFTINMISEYDSSYEFSSFKFCDLAGAERCSKTGNAGDRLKEAGGINKSLVVLGRCLEAVQNNQKPSAKKERVPVRESQLTFLLQSSLMGREKFVMIVNLLPTADYYEENINVLHFGSIANKIVTRKTKAKKYPSRSSRYTYFMQNAVTNMNSSLAFQESM